MIVGIPLGIITVVVAAIVVTNASVDIRSGVYNPGSGYFLASLLTAILGGLVMVVYEFLMLRAQGQTLGKKLMGIKVVRVGGTLDAGGLPQDAALKRAGCALRFRVPAVDSRYHLHRQPRHSSERAVAVVGQAAASGAP